MLKTTLFAALLSVIAWKYYNMAVPNDFEAPHKFRIEQTVLGIIELGVRTARYLDIDYGGKHQLFRSMTDNLITAHDIPEVKIENRKIAGVHTRVYRPVSIKDSKDVPILIYYHGGAYFCGSLNFFHEYLNELSLQANAVIISVDYRMAPEHPYPAPTDDCHAVTKYVLESKDEFGDTNKVILAGDSAGGNAVAVMTQRLKEENMKMPKLQVLIYPWTQLIVPQGDLKYDLPEYYNWYTGVENYKDILPLISENKHFLLIDQEERERLISYLDVSLIPEKLRYEERYKNYDIKKLLPKPDEELNPLLKNKEVSDKLKKLFTAEVSPGLAAPEKLKGLPKAFFIMVGHDDIRDDGLCYSERLRKAGVDVEVKMYENAYHGLSLLISKKTGYQVARDMLDDLAVYINKNI